MLGEAETEPKLKVAYLGGLELEVVAGIVVVGTGEIGLTHTVEGEDEDGDVELGGEMGDGAKDTDEEEKGVQRELEREAATGGVEEEVE